MGGDRPELQGPPEIFYNATEARKYTNNNRIIEVQTQLTRRAVELLHLPEDGIPKLLLDLGCGSGLSGEILEEEGHLWMGLDISEEMLSVALEREVEGHLCLSDLGEGVPFRAGVFDGAISISALQWLCNADTSTADPRKRLHLFFRTLYRCLAKDARAVLQFYPRDSAQSEMLTRAAMEAGFTGGLVVDYPNSTRARKTYLVLMVGTGPLPEGDDEDAMSERVTVDVSHRRTRSHNKKIEKRREWVLSKKARRRSKGHEEIPADTKFTARKRKPRF